MDELRRTLERGRTRRLALVTVCLQGTAVGCDMLETDATDDGSTATAVDWSSPVALVQGLDAPSVLAQRHTELVWGDAGGRVEKIDKDGSGRAALADAPGAVTDLEIAELDAYWLDGENGRIWTAPLDAGEPRLLAITATPPGALEVDATSLYWIEQGGRVMAMSRYGGTPMTLALLSGEVADLATDGVSLYVSLPYVGRVEALPIYGGVSVVLASEQAEPRSLAVHGQQLYWATDSAVMTLDLLDPDAEPLVVASGLGRPTALAIAGGFVYWSSRLDAAVSRAPKLGGAAELVAGEQQDPGSVVVDTQAVFWVAAGTGAEGGALWRIGTL